MDITNDQQEVAISIVVPVFNVAPYLEQCLDSILNQTFKNFEVILVNDCSTDRSAEICEHYKNTNPTIIQYIDHKSNQGTSVARNSGLNAIKGKYFTFVDPDDYLPETTLQYLYDGTDNESIDIVKGNNIIFNGFDQWAAKYNTNKPRLFGQKDLLSVLYRHELIRGHPWGKLFNTKKFRHIKFTPNVKMAQDLLYCAEVFSCADSLRLIDKNVYFYRIRPTGSTGRKYETGAYLSWLDVIEEVGKFASTSEEKTSHLFLKIRTLHQLIRECRGIDHNLLAPVIKEVGKRKQAWSLSLLNLLQPKNISTANIIRYIQYRYIAYRLSKK